MDDDDASKIEQVFRCWKSLHACVHLVATKHACSTWWMMMLFKSSRFVDVGRVSTLVYISWPHSMPATQGRRAGLYKWQIR
jgi:hypothetical protein